MSKTLALAHRELQAYFHGPIAYVVMVILLGVLGVFFGLFDFRPGSMAEMRTFFFAANWVLSFVVPIMTMRLVSEEMSKGTIETLMTAPVTDTQVVLGKYIAAMEFFIVALTPSALYVLALMSFSAPDVGPILAGYVGLLLSGMLFVAIGLLASVCTRSQIVAAMVSMVFLSIMTILCYMVADQDVPPWLRRGLLYVGFTARYQNFIRGTIPLEDVVYFLSLTVLALFLSVKIIESRKWRA